MTKRLSQLIQAADERDQAAAERTRERWKKRNQRRVEMRAMRSQEPTDDELDRRAAEMLAEDGHPRPQIRKAKGMK